MRGSFRGRPAFRGRGRGRFQRGNRGGSQFAYGSKKNPEKKLDTVEGQQVDVEQVSKTCSISCDDHFVSGNKRL